MSQENVMEKLISSQQWLDEQNERPFYVLYSCEFGSRAWGMNSKNSDYDIRFVYGREKESYLSLNIMPDTITINLPEYNIDAHGWDIGKFLKLAKNGNASPYEWMGCPIYSYDHYWYARTAKALQTWFNPWKISMHYMQLARKHYQRFVVNREYVNTKRYLYIYRALLSAEHVVETSSRPPIKFINLMERVRHFDALYQALYKTLAQKMTDAESDHIHTNKLLNIDIENRTRKIGEYLFQHEDSLFREPPTWEQVNDVFRESVSICDKGI